MPGSDYELFYGKGATPAKTWSMDPREALYQKRIHGENCRLPADLAVLSLEQLQAEADKLNRPLFEAKEAEERARRIANAPNAIDRALLSGPPRRRTPSRIRAAFLNQLERWGSISQAAAAVGVDRRTIQRWRQRRPEFDKRCEEALGRRGEILEDEGVDRARRATRRPFFYGGKKVGEVEQYNDNLLVRLIGQFESRRRRGPTPGNAPAAPTLTAEAVAGIVRATVEATMRELSAAQAPSSAVSQDARQDESQPPARS